MKVLLISYYSPVENGARPTQLIGILSLLIELGCKVDMYIPKDKDDLKIIENVNNHFRYELYNLNKINIYNITQKSLMNKIFRYITYYVIPSPDKGTFFSLKVLFKTVKIRKKYDIVLCLANPLSTSIIGYTLKALGLSKKFYIDSGDPYFKHYKNLGKRGEWIRKLLEKKVMRSADKVIIPVENQLEQFPFLSNNFKIIEQIFPEKKMESGYYVDSSIINLCYAGRFYKDIRDPYELIVALKNLKCKGVKFNFHIFSLKIEKFVLEYLKNYDLLEEVNITENVDREVLIDIMSKMDILINILNKGLHQFPSKLIDYQIAGAPVLNIGYEDSKKKFKIPGAFAINNNKLIERQILFLIQVEKSKNNMKKFKENVLKYRMLFTK